MRPGRGDERALEGQRTLRLEEMAEAEGVPNPGLIGAPTFGYVPASGMREKVPFEETTSMKEVLLAVKWSKPQSRGSVRPLKLEVDEEVV